MIQNLIGLSIRDNLLSSFVIFSAVRLEVFFLYFAIVANIRNLMFLVEIVSHISIGFGVSFGRGASYSQDQGTF